MLKHQMCKQQAKNNLTWNDLDRLFYCEHT